MKPKETRARCTPYPQLTGLCFCLSLGFVLEFQALEVFLPHTRLPSPRELPHKWHGDFRTLPGASQRPSSPPHRQPELFGVSRRQKQPHRALLAQSLLILKSFSTQTCSLPALKQKLLCQASTCRIHFNQTQLFVPASFCSHPKSIRESKSGWSHSFRGDLKAFRACWGKTRSKPALTYQHRSGRRATRPRCWEYR